MENEQILQSRTEAFNKLEGPRVGDYLKTASGYLRFIHDWGESIQTTTPKFGLGSFYLGDGYVSYSGALDPSIHKSELQLTDEVRSGAFWFFRNDFQMAHNGIDVMVDCKVYERI